MQALVHDDRIMHRRIGHRDTVNPTLRVAANIVNRKLKCPLFRILKCPLVDKKIAVSSCVSVRIWQLFRFHYRRTSQQPRLALLFQPVTLPLDIQGRGMMQ